MNAYQLDQGIKVVDLAFVAGITEDIGVLAVVEDCGIDQAGGGLGHGVERGEQAGRLRQGGVLDGDHGFLVVHREAEDDVVIVRVVVGDRHMVGGQGTVGGGAAAAIEVDQTGIEGEVIGPFAQRNGGPVAVAAAQVGVVGGHALGEQQVDVIVASAGVDDDVCLLDMGADMVATGAGIDGDGLDP